METKITIGIIRFSYVSVWRPKSVNESEAKYRTSIIISKDDDKTLKQIKKAIKAAEQVGTEKFGAKFTKGANFYRPLRDGDTDRPDDEAYKNSYFINASSFQAPRVVDRNIQPILEQQEFYSGCYGYVSVNFYPFNVAGSKGIACGLNNVQKIKDGEPLSGRSKPEDDFDIVEDDEDDILA